MLRIAKYDMKKSSSILVIRAGEKNVKPPKKMAAKYKGKGKKIAKPNPPKVKVSAASECFYCKVKGHWKRNCPKYLMDVKSGYVSKASSSDNFIVEINVTTSIKD